MNWLKDGDIVQGTWLYHQFFFSHIPGTNDTEGLKYTFINTVMQYYTALEDEQVQNVCSIKGMVCLSAIFIKFFLHGRPKIYFYGIFFKRILKYHSIMIGFSFRCIILYVPDKSNLKTMPFS